MNIPSVAVDAAKNAGDSFGLELTSSDIEKLLEAAAPFITAQALRELQDKTGAELKDAPPPNWEEDDYAAGYVHGLNFADDLLIEGFLKLERSDA